MINFLLLALVSLQGPQGAPAPAGWTVKEATGTDGKKSLTASVRSDDGKARLVVRCDTAVEKIVSVQYLPQPRLPEGDSKLVTVTFDEARADMGLWEFPGSGAYSGEAANVWPLVSGIAGAKKIRVTTWADGDAPASEAVFSGPGNDALFRRVYAACGFPYQTPPVGVTRN